MDSNSRIFSNIDLLMTTPFDAGILNTLGELMVGWIGDKDWMSSSLLYAACMLCCALATALMPLVNSYPQLLGILTLSFNFHLNKKHWTCTDRSIGCI